MDQTYKSLNLPKLLGHIHSRRGTTNLVVEISFLKTTWYLWSNHFHSSSTSGSGAIATALATAHPNRQGLAIKWENVNRMEAFEAGRP